MCVPDYDVSPIAMQTYTLPRSCYVVSKARLSKGVLIWNRHTEHTKEYLFSKLGEYATNPSVYNDQDHPQPRIASVNHAVNMDCTCGQLFIISISLLSSWAVCRLHVAAIAICSALVLIQLCLMVWARNRILHQPKSPRWPTTAKDLKHDPCSNHGLRTASSTRFLSLSNTCHHLSPAYTETYRYLGYSELFFIKVIVASW